MNEGKILILNLSQGRLGEDSAALLGAMVITKFQLATMGRISIPENERRDFFLYVDEFQNFATTSFIKILSEARKYRLNLTLANQYIAQVSEDVQAAILGNAGTLISFLVGAEDARRFFFEFGQIYKEADFTFLAGQLQADEPGQSRVAQIVFNAEGPDGMPGHLGQAEDLLFAQAAGREVLLVGFV